MFSTVKGRNVLIDFVSRSGLENNVYTLEVAYIRDPALLDVLLVKFENESYEVKTR